MHADNANFEVMITKFQTKKTSTFRGGPVFFISALNTCQFVPSGPGQPSMKIGPELSDMARNGAIRFLEMAQ